MKNKNILKSIFLLSFVIFTFCFSGCYYPNDPSEDVSGYDVSSFIAVYRNETNEQGILLENFATNVYSKLQAQFESENLVTSDKVTQILKVVVYELALNKNASSFSSLNNNANLDNYLISLQEEYRLNASYIGLSLENKDKFTNYVFENIIINSQNSQTDKTTVDNIVDSEYTNKLELCINSTITGGDSASKNMFLLSDSLGFSTIEAKQYQSIIISPSKSGKFGTLMFTLQSEESLNLEVKITYHNIQDGTSESDSKTFNINKSTSPNNIMTYYETKQTSFISTINKSFDSNIFNSESVISNAIENNTYSLASYYKAKETKNNIITTSIDTSLLNTDFCENGFIEITFSPDKNANFKFGLFAFVVA